MPWFSIPPAMGASEKAVSAAPVQAAVPVPTVTVWTAQVCRNHPCLCLSFEDGWRHTTFDIACHHLPAVAQLPVFIAFAAIQRRGTPRRVAAIVCP